VKVLLIANKETVRTTRRGNHTNCTQKKNEVVGWGGGWGQKKRNEDEGGSVPTKARKKQGREASTDILVNTESSLRKVTYYTWVQEGDE